MDIKSFESLFARLDDLKKCAIRGNLGISAFLSPREIYASERYLNGSGASFIAFGGYADAERKRIYILPEFIEAASDISVVEEYGYSSGIDALLIKGSGFESLSHRAVMGSLLGLGVERDVLGDIILQSENSAIVLCDAKMTSFFESSIERIGRDKVSVTRIELDAQLVPARQFLHISDTVASPRLDCIVAALCSLSRERAREKVSDALVELNYECEERPDKEVNAPAVISVRGIGKFRVLSVSDKSRKGRYRLIAEKYL